MCVCVCDRVYACVAMYTHTHTTNLLQVLAGPFLSALGFPLVCFSLYAGDVVDALLWLLLNMVGLVLLHDRPASPLALTLHCLCHIVNAVSTCLCLVWTRVNYQSQEEFE